MILDEVQYISDLFPYQQNGQKAEQESEIDLLIEEGDTIYPIEIKLSANPRLSMTNAFDIIDKMNGKKRGNGTVICMYEAKIILGIFMRIRRLTTPIFACMMKWWR